MAGMRQETAIDGFRLAYERAGRIAAGPAVLLLHGWPGDRTDYREVVPLAQAQREFWYQAFHNTELATQLVDGRADAVRAYLRHFWSHWSGPGYEPAPGHLDHLVSVYGAPGAFTASIAWYRAGAGSVAASLAELAPDPGDRIAVPATVLWPEYDPLFPRAWSDRIGEFFAAAELAWLDGAGHFSPLEAAGEFAAAIVAAVRTSPD